MSFVSDVFTKTAVLVPKKSGFNQDSEHLFTTMCGVLTPCFVLETLPNSDYSIGCNFDVKLPPLASDFYGKVDACIEMFWVSNRALYGGWPEFATLPKYPGRDGTNYGSPGITVNGSIANQKRNPVGFNADSLITTGDHNSGAGEDARTETFINVPNPAGYANPVHSTLPNLIVQSSNVGTLCGPGTLSDYLGIKLSGAAPGQNFTISNPFPFLAYHRIWDKFYRCSQLESPAFIKPASGDVLSWKSLPWQRMTTNTTISSPILNDGENILNLRKRKFALDYFTSATPTPWGIGDCSDGSFTHRQDGLDPKAVTIESIMHEDSENGDMVLGLTIPMLRAANTLQQFLEQRQLSGTWKFREQVGRLYGGKPMDLDLEPRFLGRLKTNVYNNSISQSQQTDGSDTEGKAFSGLMGNSVARPVGGANGSLCNFHSEEWGILMGIFSLVPHAYYSTGTDKMFSHQSMYDYADALLQNLGVQPIHQYELVDFNGGHSTVNNVFGYTKPYAEWMYKKDYVSGLFRDAQNLDYMCLQRSFNALSNPTINSAFVEIPEDYLDQVSATSAKISEFGCMVDAFFPCKTVLPLQKFIIPTLGTPEFMSTAIVNNRHSHM